MLNIGLIGAGRMGRLHAEHLISHIPSAKLIMVADALEEVARECAERYAIPSATQDYRAVLDHPDIQAVVICSTPDTHAWFIEEAAQAGKHIFCEKPIANDLPSIDRTLDVVERVGVKLQVGFNRRFDAKFTASINLGMSSKMRPGYLSNGKQVGEWTTYDKNGNV